MKKIYVKPVVVLVVSNVETSILAGSPDPNSDYDFGGDGSGNGQEGQTGTSHGGGSLAKNHQFNAWETWDEY